MPIILLWNAAAAPRERQFKRWLKELTKAAGGIGGWLGKRVKEGQRIERATAGFPVFRFYNLALTARVASAQFGALLSEPVATLGQHFRNIGDAWRVDREIANRAREAQLVVRLLGVVERIAKGTLASIDRFATPSAAMFDPRRGQASDLIGLSALTFNALARGHTGILHRAQGIARALRTPPADAGTGAADAAVPPPPAADPAESATLPLAMRLDEGVRYIAATLLVLPAATALLIHMGRDLLLWIRQSVLDLVTGYETWVLDLRESLLRRLRDGLTQFSELATGLFAMAETHVTGLVRHWAGFGQAYIGGVLDGVSAFARDFRQFWAGVHELIQQSVRYAATLMSLDLTEVIHQSLLVIEQAVEFLDFHYYAYDESPRPYDAPGTPIRVTLGELALAEGGGATARDELGRALGLLEEARAGASGLNFNIALAQAVAVDMNVFGLIAGAQRLVPRLGTAPPPAAAQPDLVYTAAAEPDLAALIVRPVREKLTGALGHAATGMQRGIEGMVTGATTLLDGTAERFHGAALNAARLGSVAQWQRLVDQADAMTARVFPAAEPGPPTGLERLGATFGVWLTGNFATIGAVLSGYLRFVLDEWRQHLDANADTPVVVDATSPRKLLLRAELGRVHMPRMRISVASGLPDAALAALVAHRFRGEVQHAHATGRDRLAALAG